MLVNKSESDLIQMLELWVYKTDMKASEFARIVDCEEGFKVGVLDYIDSDFELVTNIDNMTEKEAKKLRQIILEAVNIEKSND